VRREARHAPSAKPTAPPTETFRFATGTTSVGSPRRRRSRRCACGVQPHRAHCLDERPRRHSATVRRLFAMTLVSEPNVCAALTGTLIKCLDADHICWGRTHCGPGRGNGRSRACAGSKSPKTCRQNMGMRHLGQPTVRLRPPFSAATMPGSTTSSPSTRCSKSPTIDSRQ
jgi:hypothetical protein